MAYYSRANEILTEKLKTVRCDCHWDTGDHSPECPVSAAWADACEEAEDEAYQAELAAEAQAGEIEADRRASQFYGG
jgi:hypothetical protein